MSNEVLDQEQSKLTESYLQESCHEAYQHDLLDADTNEEKEKADHDARVDKVLEANRKQEELEQQRQEADENNNEVVINEVQSEEDEGDLDEADDDIEYDIFFSSPDI